jgi:hypothetical protein
MSLVAPGTPPAGTGPPGAVIEVAVIELDMSLLLDEGGCGMGADRVPRGASLSS